MRKLIEFACIPDKIKHPISMKMFYGNDAIFPFNACSKSASDKHKWNRVRKYFALATGSFRVVLCSGNLIERSYKWCKRCLDKCGFSWLWRCIKTNLHRKVHSQCWQMLAHYNFIVPLASELWLLSLSCVRFKEYYHATNDYNAFFGMTSNNFVAVNWSSITSDVQNKFYRYAITSTWFLQHHDTRKL